jgi:hypothetical protein
MTENELDALLSAKLKSCVSGRGLPEGFAGKLKASVRRSKRTLKLCIVLAAALTAVLGITLSSLARSPSPDIPEKCVIIAERNKKTTEKVSGWMLLGFLRDCFKRNRNGKRKEED